MESNRWSRLAALYAGTVFVSAFLLFQIQPLITRYILPWYGGGPAVWTTCLVFFQTLLFAGYLYAHLSEHYFGPRLRSIVHLVLIGAALLTLPIAPSDWWKPADGDHPAARILTLLAVCVGLPYFVLSSTGPLVQAWFSQTLPGRSPYRLYSLSNLGSLLALLSYPAVVEPLLDGREQSWSWTAGFVLFSVMCAKACWQTTRLPPAIDSAGGTTGGQQAADQSPPAWLDRLLWLMLPALASILLLATTNHICQDVPSIPFLWIVPLSLYLLSFIIAFDHERWYWRLPFALAALVATYLTVVLYNPRPWGYRLLEIAQRFGAEEPEDWIMRVSYENNLLVQLTGLFALCMLCHGELVRLRPAPRYLTSFYLMIAAGGALGGLLVSLLAPLVFHNFLEWKIGLVAGFALAGAVAFVLTRFIGSRRPRWNIQTGIRALGIAIVLAGLADVAYILRHDDLSKYVLLDQTRNFYGVLSVIDEYPDDPEINAHVLYNGGTRHGLQYMDSPTERFPTTYYTKASGVGRAFDFYQFETVHLGGEFRVGAVGLGVGTLAAYLGRPWQTLRFYEINPEVVRLAEKDFTFLSEARERTATVEIVLGDARLSLERELANPQKFNLLVLDAFTSDSIPIHLLTIEAFELYLQHLAPGGAIAVHVSNRNLMLAPVVYGVAEQIGFAPVRIVSVDSKRAGWAAEWVILSQNEDLLESLRGTEAQTLDETPQAPFPLWTDQRHNLLEVLR